MQGRHNPELSWEHSELMAHSQNQLCKKKGKSDVGQRDCARSTGVNGAVPSHELPVSLPEAIKTQGGLIIVCVSIIICIFFLSLRVTEATLERHVLEKEDKNITGPGWLQL